MTPPPDAVQPRATVDVSMWRALGVFRLLALGYAGARFAASYRDYTHPTWAAALLVGMAAWSGWTVLYYRRPTGRLVPMVVADVAVAVAAVLSTDVVESHTRVAAGVITLPTIWSSAPALSCAIAFGWRGGLAGALAIGAADYAERGAFSASAVHNMVIMVLAGTAVGYVCEVGRNAERTLVRAQRLEAATRERQRLSRDIHDGVLQVLALVQRQGLEAGGQCAELAQMAGQQELALRALVNSWHEVERTGSPGVDSVELDLCALLGRLAGPRITLSGPGGPVLLPSAVAREAAAAVSAALDNVRVHGGPGADGRGARTWILVEDEVSAVLVTVRDDGPGIPPGRLEEARLAGRLGMAHSITGRLHDLGGTVEVVSIPGQGTEVELRIPRGAPGARRDATRSATRQTVQ